MADDHQLFRESLAARLEQEEDLEVVGGAGNAEEAAWLMRDADVLIIDVDMPGPVFDALGNLARRWPEKRVLALAPYWAHMLEARCRNARVSGMVMKTEPLKRLLAAIRDIAEDKEAFSVPANLPPGDGAEGLQAHLTRREMDVLELLAQGMSMKQVAGSLCISYKTVDYHTSNVMKKLNLRNRAELVHLALRERIISLQAGDGQREVRV